MKILAIETSCDETAVAIVDETRKIHCNLVRSQMDDHRIFGGVVPEIAARAHAQALPGMIKAALSEAKCGWDDIDAVAATCGPGLIGGVMVGMVSAKALAAARNIPFVAVNHLEGHALTARLTDNVEFPYILLLVSGGHSQILIAESVGQYKEWGTTLDDAAGECFDKAAKLMGLPYPGGPEIEKIADQCADPIAAAERFPLPRPLIEKNKNDLSQLNFSFSGLKTAVRTHIDHLPSGDLKRQDIADLACAFQMAMADIMQARLDKAIARFKQEYKIDNPVCVVAGGVAANQEICARLKQSCVAQDAQFVAPPLNLSGDNAAMIAWAGLEHFRQGCSHSLEFKARPRWPLTELA